MKPYKCPVCNGTTKVPSNFYDDVVKEFSSAVNLYPIVRVPCRTCDSQGVLWGPIVEVDKGSEEGDRTAKIDIEVDDL